MDGSRIAVMSAHAEGDLGHNARRANQRAASASVITVKLAAHQTISTLGTEADENGVIPKSRTIDGCRW